MKTKHMLSKAIDDDDDDDVCVRACICVEF
jgi:hypothetical protein